MHINRALKSLNPKASSLLGYHVTGKEEAIEAIKTKNSWTKLFDKAGRKKENKANIYTKSCVITQFGCF